MKIGIFYFSATGVTEEYARLLAHEIVKRGTKVHVQNILIPDSRSFNDHDAYIFGFPVYAGRLPAIAEEWLQTIKCQQKRCSMFFTYGARELELAHQVGYYLLRKAGFKVALSAEFVGRHSFNVAKGWLLAETRPNTEDREVARQFAGECFERFTSNMVEWQYDLKDFVYRKRERKIITGPFSLFYPSRKQECRMCNQCEEECPVIAFNATSGTTDKENCIQCMHCVYICPDDVIEVGDATELYKKFKEKNGLTVEVVMNKRSKIIY